MVLICEVHLLWYRSSQIILPNLSILFEHVCIYYVLCTHPVTSCVDIIYHVGTWLCWCCIISLACDFSITAPMLSTPQRVPVYCYWNSYQLHLLIRSISEYYDQYLELINLSISEDYPTPARAPRPASHHKNRQVPISRKPRVVS